MTADVSRSTFRPEKRYSGVRMQQGRVQVDADWNEELDILAHGERAARRDLVGPAAAPKGSQGGFQVGVAPGGTDLTISPGRMYVDGLLAELAASPTGASALTATGVTLAAVVLDGAQLRPGEWLELAAQGAGPWLVRATAVDAGARLVTFAPALSAAQVAAFAAAGGGEARRMPAYLAQPDLPGPPFAQAGTPPTLALADGAYLAYLDVWERTVTALQDPEIREVALGGPDTATRTQVVCQVWLQPVGAAEAAAGCGAALPEWEDRIAAGTGTLSARAQPQADAGDCLMPAQAGFRRLENQLYRVEIHQGGPPGTATFKWSRENGSVVASVTGQPAADQLVVGSAGRDAALGFATGDFVELTDDGRELRGQPGTLVELTGVQGTTLTFSGPAVSLADFPLSPRVRRWESAGALPVQVPATNDGYLPLEDGVEVRFDAGTHRAGDHWLIPARAATADLDWPRDGLGAPLARPPDGVRHHYARLALLSKSGPNLSVLADCRPRLPALSTICADDVCYEGICAGAGPTVQAAIDFLCQEKDLRFHNQHLHGTGVVCGLQVHCDFDQGQGDHVEVLPGYAIDCDGNDLQVTGAARAVPIVQLASAHDAAAGVGQPRILDPTTHTGDASLLLVADPAQPGGVGFAVEPYDATRDTTRAALDGTVLMDFYQRCVLPLVEFFKKETTPASPDAPDSPRDHLRTALVGLAAEVVNPAGGQRIFVSRAEHALLLQFYTDLRALLQSQTFCSMFAKARPYPSYDALGQAAKGIDTAFARDEHVRLRPRPRTHEAFSAGPGLNPLTPATTLNRYDLDRNVLSGRVDPLAGVSLPKGTTTSGAGPVQDVAFSQDGSTIHVIVPTRDGKDTFFRSGTIQAQAIRWGAVSVICGVKLMTLATTAADPKFVYAAGLGRGLYRIDPADVRADLQPLAAFAATGHLEVRGSLAVAGAGAGAGPAEYTSIVQVQVPQGTLSPAAISLPMPGSDGLALYTAADGARRDTVYVVVGPDASLLKHVQAYDSATAAAVTQGTPATPVDLPVMSTAIALAVFPTRSTLLVSLADDFTLRVADLTTNTWAVHNVLPLQVAPVALAVDAQRQFAYALNYASSSVSVIDGTGPLLGAAFDATAELLPALAAYRQRALDAFADLLAGAAQHLKDCLCELLLVNCPACDDRSRKLRLAAVKIVDSQVHHVCNFSGRHYVKTFPTVGYWLSLVPVVPLVGRLVERLCCAILPDHSGRYTAPGYTAPVAPNLTHDPGWFSVLHRAVAGAQGQDLGTKLPALLGRGGILRSMGASALAHPAGFRLPLAAAEPAAPGGWAIVNQPTASVQASLAGRGVTVLQAPYDPGSQSVVAGAVDSFRDPPAGSRVTLYEQGGVVKYYTIAAGPPPAELAAQVTALSGQLAARDAQVQALQGQLQQVLQHQAELQQLQSRQQETLSALQAHLTGPPPPAPPAPPTPPPPPSPPPTPPTGGGRP